MIVYLRGSDLTEYNQELVRADLVELVLDAQQRGDDIHTVFDGRYQEICDEIMEAFPRKTVKQRIFGHIENGAMCTAFIMTYMIALFLIEHFVSKKEGFMVPVSYGSLINVLLISIGSCFFVEYLCKHAFTVGKKKYQFFRDWAVGTLVFSVLLFLPIILKTVAFNIHILGLVVIMVAAICVDYTCSLLKER